MLACCLSEGKLTRETLKMSSQFVLFAYIFAMFPAMLLGFYFALRVCGASRRSISW